MFMEDKMPVIALIIGVLLAAADQIIKYFVLTYSAADYKRRRNIEHLS